MDPNGLALLIHIPYSKELKPLAICVRSDASVEEVIGYALYEYVNENRKPPLPEKLKSVSLWNLRIVEDDGDIDDDFPALDRLRRIKKFAFDQYALVSTEPEDEEPVQLMENRQAFETSATQIINTSVAISPSAPTTSVFLKVHLYSTLEIKQTTTMQMPLNISMQEVFVRICQKRKYDTKDYILKMPDTKTDVPLDKTLEELKVTEFCVLKRSSGGGM